MLEHFTARRKYSFVDEESMKGMYRGYGLAVFIGVMHLNIYATFRNLWNELNVFGSQK